MAFEKKVQDPSDDLDYSIDWQSGDKPFLKEGEVISSSTWTAYTMRWVETDDITLHTDSYTDTVAIIWVKASDSAASVIAGKKYYGTNTIVSDQGRKKSLSYLFEFKEE